MARPQGRVPTATKPVTRNSSTSMIATSFEPPLATYTHLPLGWTTTPFGLGGVGRSILIVDTTAFLATSTTDTTPPISAVTNARRPSGVNAASRGRLPTRIVVNALSADVSITVTV